MITILVLLILASIWLGYNIKTGYRFAKAWDDEPEVYKATTIALTYIAFLFFLTFSSSLILIYHLLKILLFQA